MKITSGVLAAFSLAGFAWSAQAQGVPQGTYLQSCGNVGMQGDTLVAMCRTADGRERRASLSAVSRCVGDIGNNNGRLQCNYGGPQRQGVPAPGYGDRRTGEQGSERCRGLHREAEELRGRLDREFNSLERARIEGRLREAREQEERCR
jgi:hypothetical protein